MADRGAAAGAGETGASTIEPSRLAVTGRSTVLVRPGALFALTAVAAWGALLYLGRGMTFWSDEWAFIDGRSLTSLDSLLRPHNEHWSTLPVIVYRGLFDIVGLHSYIPYLAVLLAFHLAVASLVYALLARTNGPWIAFPAGVVVLFLGSGVENLFWAFQIGFVGATALSLCALFCLDVGRGWRSYAATAVLLTLALATAGVALFFSVVVGVELLLDRRRWRGLPWLAIPVGAYAAWYLTWGRGGVDTYGHPFTLEAVLRLPAFVAAGIGSALTSFVGIPAELAVAGLALVVAWGTWRTAHGMPVPARTIAALTGIITQYMLIGLVRGQLGEGAAGYPRYAYETVVLLLVGASPWLGRVRLPGNRQARVATIVAGALIFETVLVINLRFLAGGRDLFLDRAGVTRALVTLALRYGDAPNVDPNRSLVLIPSPARVRQLVASYGDPTGDDLVPDAVAPITPDQMDRALVDLAGMCAAGCASASPIPMNRVAAAAAPAGPRPRIVQAANVRAQATGECIRLVASGPDATAVVAVGATSYLRAPLDETMPIALGHDAPPALERAAATPLAAGTWYAVRLPDLVDGRPWQLGLWPAENQSMDICAAPAP